MRNLILSVAALGVMGFSGTSLADCPYKAAVCNDGSAAKIAMCWHVESLSCLACNVLQPNQVCKDHGGLKCMSTDTAGLNNIGESVANWVKGKTDPCK